MLTLIEVLLALAIIAIALTALMKVTSQNISITQRLKEKNSSHWVAMQGIAMIQLGLLNTKLNQEVTEATNFLGERWYWRIFLVNTPVPSVQQITIKVSKKQEGPYVDPLIGYRYVSE